MQARPSWSTSVSPSGQEVLLGEAGRVPDEASWPTPTRWDPAAWLAIALFHPLLSPAVLVLAD